MKRWLLAFILICACAYLASAETDSTWKAYLTEDGNVLVTDKPGAGAEFETLTIGRGQDVFITVEGIEDVKYYSSSYYVAHADENGMLVTGSSGNARIKVYYTPADFVEFRLQVKSEPTKIAFPSASLTLDPGQQYRLVYTLTPKNAGGRIDFYSANEDAVLVDAEGTALAPGRSVVSAELYNGLTAECEVVVRTPPPAKLTLEPLHYGYANESFVPEYRLTGGYNESVTFTSDNPDVCAINADGSILCLKPGGAYINAYASGGDQASCFVNVQPGASAISAGGDIYLYEGGYSAPDVQVTGGSGKYDISISDTRIACAEPDGRLHALKSGQTAVTFTAPGGIACTQSIFVLPAPQLDLRLKKTLLGPNETTLAYLTELPVPLLPAAYASTDTGVFTIDAQGIVHTYAPGRGILEARIGGLTYTLNVQVLPIAMHIAFDAPSIQLGAGDSAQLSARPVDGAGAISYASSDESVAYTDGDTLYALKSGEAAVTASLPGGVSAVQLVTVLPRSEHIYTDAARIAIGAGDSVKINAQLDEGTLSRISWTAGSGLISVSEDGVITSTGLTGTTYTRASVSSGAYADVEVSVLPAPTRVTLNAETLSQGGLFTHYVYMKASETLPLNVTFDGYTHVSWTCTSRDPDIAQIDTSGVITAVKSGTARVTLSVYSGLTAEVLVEVGE